MPMLSIKASNAAVCEAMMKVPKVEENEEMECDEQIVCQGKYQHFTDTERLIFGKRAYEHRIASTIHYFISRPGEE